MLSEFIVTLLYRQPSSFQGQTFGMVAVFYYHLYLHPPRGSSGRSVTSICLLQYNKLPLRYLFMYLFYLF